MTMTSKEPSAATSDVGLGRARQTAIFRAGALGRAPSILTDARTLERRAKKAMSPRAWAYLCRRRCGGGPDHAVQPGGIRAVADRAAHAAWSAAARSGDVGSRYAAVIPAAVSTHRGGVGCGRQQRRDHCPRGCCGRHGVHNLLAGL